MKKILLLFTLLFAAFSASADLPFRVHRQDGFLVLPSKSGDVLFLGNSITNMHEWKEAFSNSSSVKGRGVSGGYSSEIADMLETYLNGKPSKVFFMIGTNDLGTSGYTVDGTVANISCIIRRITLESPETEVYFESILPSTSGLRTLANIQAVNKGVKEYIDDLGNEKVKYIDLYSHVPTNSGGDWSYDGLHCTAKSYAAWCNIIKEYVGIDTAYPSDYASMTLNRGGITNAAYGMRATTFASMPVSADNVLFIGDEMVHSGEWAELLGNAKVLNRGTGWGWAGGPFNILLSELQCIFHNGATPAKVLVYAGNDALSGNGTVASAVADYRTLVDSIKSLSPTTHVYLCGLIPGSDATKNANKYVPFNDSLRAMSEGDERVTYIDTYTPMLSGSVANTDLINGNYILGRGYVKFANIIAPYIGGCNPISEEEAAARYALNVKRNALGQAVQAALLLAMSADKEAYDADALSQLKETTEKACAALGAGVDSDSLAALTAAVTAATNAAAASFKVKASTEAEEHWYSFCSTLRNGLYAYEDGENKLYGGAQTNYKRMMWKFVAREEGTYDIINRNSGRYISPAAAYNAQITTSETAPATGWKLTPAATAGMFTLSNGTCELNQTQAALQNAIYNWSAGGTGTDISDTGCQFTIKEVTAEPLTELTTGWYRIKATNVTSASNMEGHYVYNGAEYRQNASNSYPLFLSTDGSEPAATDAAYYVRIIEKNGNVYVQSANGHYINDKTCAERAMNTAINFAYSTETKDYTIGSYWMYFPTLGHIVGKASSGSANRWSVEDIDPTKQGYDVWTVEIKNATNAAEVTNDTKVTITASGISGLTSVYNGGYFFIPTGTTPQASEISCNNCEVTVNTETKTISVDLSKPVGIAKAVTETDKNEVFDLQGKRVNGLSSPGVYIVNGKKMVNR